MDALVLWSLDLTLAVQSLSGLTGLMQAFTFLGSEEFFLFVMPALYWCVSAEVGARLAVLLIASNGINALLKLAFVLPRPYWIEARVAALSTETSYGLPSGHAMNAVSVWGFLASQLKWSWAWGAALLLIFLISLSRVYLGVHFAADVLGGWLFGTALLWAFTTWRGRAQEWLARLNLWVQIALAWVVSLFYLAVAVGLLAVVPAPSVLPQWEQAAVQASPPEIGERAIDPRGLTSHVNTAGMILGLGAGLALMGRYARFSAGGPPGKRALRFVIGVAGIALLFIGLRLVLPSGDDMAALTFRYLRYALIVGWALYLAPLIFLKMRLAEAG